MIDPTHTNAPPSAGGTRTEAERAKPALTSDFETFLKMLTAQARNQDPLEPLDSTEYASQLAQFSMVEQQVQTNDLLGRLGGNEMGRLAGWVGLEVRTLAPAHFDGSPITVQPEPAATADSAYLVVRDADGAVIERSAITSGRAPLSWTGRGETGIAFPVGQYSFSVESHKNGTKLSDTPAAAYTTVTEAQLVDGEIALIVTGGHSVQASDITAIRTGG